MNNKKKILVTGGGGFLGYSICCALVKEGCEVTSFSRKHYPALEKIGVKSCIGNLNDQELFEKLLLNLMLLFILLL